MAVEQIQIELTKQIKIEINKQQLSMKEFTLKMNKSRRYVSGVLNNEFPLSFTLLAKMCKVLDLKVSLMFSVT